MKGMDVEGKKLSRRSRKDSEVLGKGKNRGLAALFLVLEIVSVVLDVFGGSKRASLAAFLLSAFGFAINIFVCFVERTTAKIKPQAEKQLGIVETVFSVLRGEENVTDLSLEDLSHAKFSSANDSVLSTPIELDLRGSTVYHANPVNKLHLRSRQVEEGPGIEGFQIVGEATPGEKLLGCGFAVRGTALCMFQWVRHLQDVTRQYIEGATEPEYVVTADDVHTLLAVECIALDDLGCQGELVRTFANEHSKIKCDPDMQREIDRHISRDEATFSDLLLMSSSMNWEPATLILSRSSFQIKINSTGAVLIEENFSMTLSIKIPVGLSKQFILTSSDSASHTFSTDYFRMRDAAVLTIRLFQSKFLSDNSKVQDLFLHSRKREKQIKRKDL